MTYTIDQVKRLVPEALVVTEENGVIAFLINGEWYSIHDAAGELILTTRHQLAIALATLERIATPFPDSDWEQRQAREALDAIKQAGGEK